MTIKKPAPAEWTTLRDERPPLWSASNRTTRGTERSDKCVVASAILEDDVFNTFVVMAVLETQVNSTRVSRQFQ